MENMQMNTVGYFCFQNFSQIVMVSQQNNSLHVIEKPLETKNH